MCPLHTQYVFFMLCMASTTYYYVHAKKIKNLTKGARYSPFKKGKNASSQQALSNGVSHN